MPVANAQAVRIEGESRIGKTPGRIRRVQLEPPDPPAYPEAIRAILSADMVVIGPGSLFTSIMPNMLVPDLVAAIRVSTAFKVFVCNVATQSGETDAFTCAQHLEAIEYHAGKGLVDLVVANDSLVGDLPEGVDWIFPPERTLKTAAVYTTDLIDHAQPWRHDSQKLGDTLLALLEERTGPLERSPLELPE
jgi:uncharacterized cofD-like protein